MGVYCFKIQFGLPSRELGSQKNVNDNLPVESTIVSIAVVRSITKPPN